MVNNVVMGDTIRLPSLRIKLLFLRFHTSKISFQVYIVFIYFPSLHLLLLSIYFKWRELEMHFYQLLHSCYSYSHVHKTNILCLSDNHAWLYFLLTWICDEKCLEVTDLAIVLLVLFHKEWAKKSVPSQYWSDSPLSPLYSLYCNYNNFAILSY